MHVDRYHEAMHRLGPEELEKATTKKKKPKVCRRYSYSKDDNEDNNSKNKTVTTTTPLVMKTRTLISTLTSDVNHNDKKKH